ncbi:MAG: LCP family protein [Clostridia bacterium]|nr:LCP family protein [Clostridia bacterium]MBR0407568.1 LCP family protein [Clostridia bacterium]
MKKAVSMICLLCFLFGILPARAEAGWTSDEWNQVVARLLSFEPDPVPPSRRISLRQSDVYLTDPAEQRPEWLNVALMSTDASDMRRNFGRSEAILVCRVNQKTSEIRLLSLPEYMKAMLPGCPNEIQLKYANCFGGPLLALDTINRELNLSVNRYCAINVDSFAEIIDGLNGVTMTLTDEEAEALGLGAGTQVLSGDDAVRYLKLRRQWDGALRFRLLLEALLRQMAASGMISGALTLVDTMLHMIDTNLTLDEIVAFAFTLLDQQEMRGILSSRLEADAEGHVSEAARQAAHDFLYGGANTP